MPRHKRKPLADETEPATPRSVEIMQRELRRIGVSQDDLERIGLLSRIATANRQTELLEAIPELRFETTREFVNAVVQAIKGEALSPDTGRAMLYAAQLQLALGPPASPPPLEEPHPITINGR